MDESVDGAALIVSAADFTDPSFDATRFVVERKRRFPIDTLQVDLKAYAEALQEQVVGLINTELCDLVHVSNKLTNLDAEMDRVRDPLPKMLTRVDKAASRIEDSQATVRRALKEYRAMDDNQNFYRRMLRLTASKQSMEVWLGALSQEVAADDDVNSSATPDALDRLNRVALECRQISMDERLCVATTADQIEERQVLLEVLQESQVRFTEVLERYLVAALQAQQAVLKAAEADIVDPSVPPTCDGGIHDTVRALLRCYHLAGKEDLARTVFVENVCQPLTDNFFSLSAITSLRATAATEGSLAGLFRDLQCALTARCIPVASLADHVSPSFRFLPAVWICVSDSVVKKMQFVFSPGIHSKFHSNYVTTHRLLAALEQHFPTRQALIDFRKSPEMQRWEKEWLLSVYFTLRTKDIQNELNDTFQGTALTRGEGLGGFHFKQTWQIHHTLFWLWSAEVFLYPLGHRWMSLSLRAAVVLSSWLGLAGATTEGRRPFHEASDDDLVALHCDLMKLEGDVKGEWLDTVSARMGCSEVRRDTDRSDRLGGGVEAPVNATGWDRLRDVYRALKGIGDDVAAAAGGTKALDEGQAPKGATLRPPRELISSEIVTRVAAQCVDRLAPQVRSLTSTYRLTRRPVPTRHSSFVPGILSPLQSFNTRCRPEITASPVAPPPPPDASEGRTFYVPSDVARHWVVSAIGRITDEYYVHSKEALQQALQAQRTLDRVRGTVAKDGDRDGTPSTGELGKPPPKSEFNDIDKMFVQVLLDFQEYGTQLQLHFDMDPTTYSNYGNLMTLVERARWLLGEVDVEPSVDTLLD